MERPYYAVTRQESYFNGKKNARTQFHEFESEEQMERFVKNTTKRVTEFGKKAGH